MTDLFIHLGMPKAASTTLQREVFSRETGYLGLTSYSKNDVVRKFKAALFAKDPLDWQRKALSWVSEVTDYRQRHWPHTKRLILSDEQLSGITASRHGLYKKWPIGENGGHIHQKNRRKSGEIVQLLKQLNGHIWKHGDIKVLIILRNQPDWLCSLYAQ